MSFSNGLGELGLGELGLGEMALGEMGGHLFSCTALFVSISQVIVCEDRLRNDLYCVGWGVKLCSTISDNIVCYRHDISASVVCCIYVFFATEITLFATDITFLLVLFAAFMCCL